MFYGSVNWHLRESLLSQMLKTFSLNLKSSSQTENRDGMCNYPVWKLINFSYSAHSKLKELHAFKIIMS